MKQARTLNEAELKLVMAHCATRRHAARDRAIVMVSFHLGLRAKEMAALTVGDVRGDDGQIRDQFTLDKTQTKGGVTRTVYLNQKLRRELRTFVPQTAAATDPLFPSQKGGHFSANTMCQLFLDIYAQCGLTGASSHSGRRSFITRLANKGINVRLLAALAGHSSIQVTQKYIDVNPDQLSAAVELL
jgi:integrase/recombinase XerD